MALTRTQILTRVKSHLRAEMTTPTVVDVHDNNLYEWINEHTADVINILLKDKPQQDRMMIANTHMSNLVVINSSLSFSGGYEDLPADYAGAIAVKASTSPTLTYKMCRLYFDPAEFARFDSSNFVITPSLSFPVALISNDRVYIKPTSLSIGFLDYVKAHPTIDGSNGSLFSNQGDNILVTLVIADYYKHIQEFELAQIQLASIGVELNVVPAYK